jgi:hypothetical protein
VFAEGRIQPSRFKRNGETHYGTDFLISRFDLLRFKESTAE